MGCAGAELRTHAAKAAQARLPTAVATPGMHASDPQMRSGRLQAGPGGSACPQEHQVMRGRGPWQGPGLVPTRSCQSAWLARQWTTPKGRMAPAAGTRGRPCRCVLARRLTALTFGWQGLPRRRTVHTQPAQAAGGSTPRLVGRAWAAHALAWHLDHGVTQSFPAKDS